MNGNKMDTIRTCFHDNEEEFPCPVGCGQKEGRIYYVQYKAKDMNDCYMQRKLKFMQIHQK